MKKTLMAVFILGAGAISLATLSRTAERQEVARPIREAELRTATNRLVELNAAITTTRNEITEKKRQLRQMQSGNQVDRELLALLEGRELSPKRWTQLREELGMGWNRSEDYVLVSKRTLRQLKLAPFDEYRLDRISEAARAVLAITKGEESAINAVVQRARSEVLARVQRTEPLGDIVAQYSIPTDPLFVQTITNGFAAEVTAILGEQRADVFLNQAMSTLTRGLGIMANGKGDTVMTIRRAVVDGEPGFSCEIKDAGGEHTSNVARGYIPSPWFMMIFPSGWEALARREGFELPKEFYQQNP